MEEERRLLVEALANEDEDSEKVVDALDRYLTARDFVKKNFGHHTPLSLANLK